jgi:hypothetical protein
MEALAQGLDLEDVHGNFCRGGGGGGGALELLIGWCCVVMELVRCALLHIGMAKRINGQHRYHGWRQGVITGWLWGQCAPLVGTP